MFENVAYSSSWQIIQIGLLFYIGVLLFLGMKEDLKTLQVPNKITFSILLLSIPLIYWNMANIGFLNFAFLAVFVMAYFKGLGGADLKAIFPLLFVFKDGVVFAGALAFIGAGYLLIEAYRHKKVPLKDLRVPYFVPIFLSFMVTVII